MSVRPMQRVTLAEIGEGGLVARSRARRVAQSFQPNARVELDFAGITEIGQAFADELFRVFAASHPNLRIAPVNTEPAVAQMIKRAVAARTAQGSTEQGA